jgi:phospholipid/cholesterol/gamma-HCH transport system ATP-binding protein
MEARRPAELSGGQRKRAALARATILDPEVIFCDEPTSGLDPVMSGAVDRLLLRFRDAIGVTIVAITHDMASVRAIADRGIMLGDGRLLAQGSLEQLVESQEPRVRQFFDRFSAVQPTPTVQALQRRMG